MPLILKFTIPLVIGNIFQQLYNMADTIIVGRYVGAGALAAVGLDGNDHVLDHRIFPGNYRGLYGFDRPAVRGEGFGGRKKERR